MSAEGTGGRSFCSFLGCSKRRGGDCFRLESASYVACSLCGSSRAMTKSSRVSLMSCSYMVFYCLVMRSEGSLRAVSITRRLLISGCASSADDYCSFLSEGALTSERTRRYFSPATVAPFRIRVFSSSRFSPTVISKAANTSLT